MPIYEYQCSSCKKLHEMWQKITEKPVVGCPTCKKPMQRLISASAFHLKGTGWYATDYKGTAAPSSKEDSKDPANQTAKNPAKDDSKSSTAAASGTEKSANPGKSTATKKDPNPS